MESVLGPHNRKFYFFMPRSDSREPTQPFQNSAAPRPANYGYSLDIGAWSWMFSGTTPAPPWSLTIGFPLTLDIGHF